MESSYRQIWRIAWPIMGASLAQNAVSLIDTVFLGLLGRTELAAGGVGVVLFLTIGFMGLGLGTGVQVLTAQALGQGQEQVLGSLLRRSLWVAGAMGLLLTLGMWWGVPPLLDWVMHDPATQATTTRFLQGRSLELLPLMIFGVLRGYFSGTAQTAYILRANLLLAASNLVLNALFVLGLQWGLAGVVAGSVLAQYLATGYLLAALKRQRYALVWSDPSGRNWLPSLFRYAGPAILQNLVGMTGWLVFFLLIERRGPLALAAANIVRSLYSFTMLPTWAFSTAVGTLVGYHWGARARQPLLQAFWRAWKLAQSLNLGIAAVLSLGAPFWVSLFSRDAAVVAQAQVDLYMVAVSLVLMPFSALLISAVVGVGAVFWAFLIEVGIIALYVAYAAILEGKGVSLTWMWSAEWVYWVPSAVALGLVFTMRVRRLRTVPVAH